MNLVTSLSIGGVREKVLGRYRGNIISFVIMLFPLVSLVLLLNKMPLVLSMLPSVLVCIIIVRRILKRELKKKGRYSISGELSVRTLLSLIPLVIYAVSSQKNLFGMMVFSVIPLLPLGEPLLGKLINKQGLEYANFPSNNKPNETFIPIRAFSNYHFFAIVLAIIVALFEFSVFILFGIIFIEAVLVAIAGFDVIKRLGNSLLFDDDLIQAVEVYKPRFILYFAAPSNSEYQVAMWIEYLERIDERFIIILRKADAFSKISTMTSHPVVVCPRIIDIDNITVHSITTAFYVNNSMYNSHMVRNNNITHVQLLHGDSDKVVSYNPVTAMFDKVFVAGQAGIERYKSHGVDIPLHKFEIVGRPQVEKVQQQAESNLPVKKVLYAPTWKGHYNDTNYCSLPVGLQIIRSLLERDITVIFRPHPYSYKDPVHKNIINDIQNLLKQNAEENGREHKWGEVAESEMSVFDCFNSVDAMISDVSSVVPDFLFSGKPFSIVAMSESGEKFCEGFPLSTVAYVIEKDLLNLNVMLDELLINDKNKELRVKAREHYLGPFEKDGYANNFVRIAKKLINNE